MKTDAIYEFLRRHYKHSRFEGRNGRIWGEDYSHVITQSVVEDLETCGEAMISRHESATGRAIRFDAELNVLNKRRTP